MKKLSLLVLVCFFVSCVVGPVYAWKGENNGVRYEINMHKWRGEAASRMERGSVYNLNIVVENDNISIENLDINIPSGFVLEGKEKKKNIWPDKNWVHVFRIKASNEVGSYDFYFIGEDAVKNKVNFSVPIIVSQKESSEYSSNDSKNVLAWIGFSIFIFAVLKVAGVVK